MRRNLNASDEAPATPWWLSGSTVCHHCLQEFAIEIGIRCNRCDELHCADCTIVVRRSRRTVCLGCKSMARRR